MKIGPCYVAAMVVLALVCGGSLAGCGAPPTLIEERSGDTALATLLEGMRARANQAALAGAVIADGGIKAVAAVGRWKIGIDKWVTVDDRFIIGPCGKAITSSLAARLVEEGRLTWETTIQDAFPRLKMRREFAGISISQLLSHRAGLPKNFTADLNPKWPYPPATARLLYVSQLVQTKPFLPPGPSMFYSNAGYIVAGAMMESLSGRDFAALMTDEIFNPLHLATAGYGAPADTEPATQPWGHVWDRGRRSLKALPTDDGRWIDPAGNVSLSMGDWAAFILQHLPASPAAGGRLLAPESLARLHGPPDNAGWAYDDAYLEFWKKEIGWPLPSASYALGWYVMRSASGRTMLHHSGTSQGFQAAVYIVPDTRGAVLLATHSRLGHGHLYRTVKKIDETYALGTNLPLPTRVSPPPAPAPAK